MNGAKATNGKNAGKRGSATVEAAIVLPVFLIVLLSLAYFIRIFYTYNLVQTSLAEVARKIGNMSYFYYVSGIKDYSDRLNDNAAQAGDTLEEQKNTLLDAFGSFNDTLSATDGTFQSGQINPEGIQQLIEKAGDLNKNMEAAQGLIQSVISDPKAELRLVMTVLAQKLSYEATKGIICLVAQGDLGAELDKRVPGDEDGALMLGIKNGRQGLSFSQSSVFGDKESLEFVVTYSMDVPLTFGLIPELKLSNKVKVIAWTGGRGASVKVEKANESENTTSSSVWVEMDQDQRYWDRGLEIEDIHVDKLIAERTGAGMDAYATSKDYPVIDGYAYDEEKGIVECYDVFTLNPFLKTYATRPKSMGYEIKKHGKRLLECDIPEGIPVMTIKEIKRTVVFIVPENSDENVEEIYKDAQRELEKYHVEVMMVKGYGAYSEPVATEELQEAS